MVSVISNLRRLPLLLTLCLSVLTIGCQADDADSDESIVPNTSDMTNVAATPRSGAMAPSDAATNATNADTPNEDAEEKDNKSDEEDEFADGNYGELDSNNTYRPRNNEFEVTLPDQYEIQPQRDGVAFISADGGFGGEVVFFEDDEPLDAEDLEDALKEIYDELLDGAAWQLSEIQPDGSVRLDWRGTTPEGQELDAISYIEQRNDMVFILNVYGIDRPYDAFLDDSQTIIGSYLTWPDDDGESDEDEGLGTAFEGDELDDLENAEDVENEE